MQIQRICGLDQESEPLVEVEMETPTPGPGELLLRVSACGVCHTELDEIEGRTAPPSLPVIPGHEVVGRVVDAGAGCHRFETGDRIGVGWIHCSDGSETENLSADFRATGRDANGGYAEFMTVQEAYACAIPDEFTDIEAAPLLCAGAIGYRALRLCGLQDGQPLGLTGFGGSGHLVLPLAQHLYPSSAVYVFARSEQQQAFARELGADWAGGSVDTPPEAPAAIIDTTPAWTPVLAALECLAPGGRLVINAIRKTDGDKAVMTGIDYERHLWREKEVKSVANICMSDIAEFLPIAAAIPMRPSVEVFALTDANRALLELHRGSVSGAKVLSLDRQ